MDPVELRRKNFVKEFPHTMASGLTIDSGDYDGDARPAPRAARPRRDPSRPGARGASGDAKQIGVGFSTYNEMCGLAPSRILGAIRYAVGGWDAATIRFQPLGSVQVVTGPRRTARVTRRPGRRSSPTSSASTWTTSRCCTATPPSRSRGWTRTAAAHSRSAASRSGTRPRRSSRRHAGSSRTSSRSRRTTSSSRTGRSRVRDRPTGA